MIRLLRGRVAVREFDVKDSPILWTPTNNPRKVFTHKGRVLGMGPPALMGFWRDARFVEYEVPWGFEVGDVVQFHFAKQHQEAWTFTWEDGKPFTMLPQDAVDGMWYD